MTSAPSPLAGVKGCVLAAGLGRRMAPITDAVPKPLLPVGNLPLIAYSLRLLAHHGIGDVMVNVHHLARALQAGLEDRDDLGVRLGFSVEDDLLGTGGGLKNMHAHIEQTCVVANSDIIFDLDLAWAVDAHRRAGALATMIVRPAAEGTAGAIEVVGEGDSGPIARILGQGEHHPQARGYMFTGVHIIEPRFLEYLPPGVQTCVVRYGYQKALSNREPLLGLVSRGYWRDAGTPADYFLAHRDALEQAMTLRHADPLAGFALTPRRPVGETVRMGADVELAQGVALRAPALLGEGVRIAERAMVGPLANLGARVHVGRDAQLEEAVVLAGARVEAGARVARALVGRRATLSLA